MPERVIPSATAAPLTRELLTYWVEHPEALGTIESIAEWWILEQRIQRAVTDVRMVLADLVKKHFVVERCQADGRNRYELNRDKRNEIGIWLARPVPTECGPGGIELPGATPRKKSIARPDRKRREPRKQKRSGK